METKWASLVSYGLTVEALTDFLPLEVTLDMQTVCHDALKVEQRCEDELGEEPRGVGDGCQRDWERFPSLTALSLWASMAGTCGIGIRKSGTLR